MAVEGVVNGRGGVEGRETRGEGGEKRRTFLLPVWKKRKKRRKKSKASRKEGETMSGKEKERYKRMALKRRERKKGGGAAETDLFSSASLCLSLCLWRPFTISSKAMRKAMRIAH